MMQINIRMHVIEPIFDTVIIQLAGEDELVKRGLTNLPESLDFSGYTNELFIFDWDGNPLKSFHQIVNEVQQETDAQAVVAERDEGKIPIRQRVFQKVAIQHPQFGLIPTEQLAIRFRINVLTKQFKNLGEAAAFETARRLRNKTFMKFNAAGGALEPLIGSD
jgi:hypothetical protein